MRLKKKYELSRKQLEKIAVFLSLNPNFERVVIFEDPSGGGGIGTAVIARFFTKPRMLSPLGETSQDLDMTDVGTW